MSKVLVAASHTARVAPAHIFGGTFATARTFSREEIAIPVKCGLGVDLLERSVELQDAPTVNLI